MEPATRETDTRPAPRSHVASWALAPYALPFWSVHAGCLLVLVTGVRASDVVVCLGLFWLRVFGITAGYHRYFSHRSYKTSRAFQFALALLGTTAVQKGVLWWAASHRAHHRESDRSGDIHSPARDGFWWAHLGWILGREYRLEPGDVPDLARYPELVWLNRHYVAPPAALGVLLFALGGLPWLVWGFFVSTVLLWHATFTINSLAHMYGSRRFDTGDESRNNFWLALLTLGEGWHNNHHAYMSSARQGLRRWEIDMTYGALRALARAGVVWDLVEPPPR